MTIQGNPVVVSRASPVVMLSVRIIIAGGLICDDYVQSVRYSSS
jgi:hypothetical protein